MAAQPGTALLEPLGLPEPAVVVADHAPIDAADEGHVEEVVRWVVPVTWVMFAFGCVSYRLTPPASATPSSPM